MLDVELGELIGELMEAFCFFSIELEGCSLSNRHALADVAAILPDLVFVVGSQPNSAASVG